MNNMQSLPQTTTWGVNKKQATGTWLPSLQTPHPPYSDGEPGGLRVCVCVRVYVPNMYIYIYIYLFIYFVFNTLIFIVIVY